MYDQIFSPQWVLDRCIEGGTIFPWAALVTSLFLSFLTFNSFKNKLKKIFIPTIIACITFTSSFVLSIVVIFLTGFLIVGCSNTAFWASITPAHKVYALIKEYEAKNGIYPKNEIEIEKLAPDLYKTIKDNSKQIYIYNPKENSFIWIIRPSYYTAVVFDTKNDYMVYKIAHFINWVPSKYSFYPPDYPKL
jgi:hypothetical protein